MTLNVQTAELDHAKLRLRTDLRFTLHHGAAAQWYVVEDDARGQYFRIGVAEYAFLSLLDGRRTLAEAQAELASLPGCYTIDEQQATGICKWVIDSGLAETRACLTQTAVDRRRDLALQQKAITWLNPFAWRIPLFNPDPALTRLYPHLRDLLGWPLVLAWLIVCITGCSLVLMRWDQLWHGRLQVISAHDFVWLAITWVCLKVVHETAHALSCKHFGGRVPQAGILLLFLIPLPYVDVTSSWRFVSKSQRILTAAAGMLAEAFISASAAIVWYRAEPGPVQFHAGNLIIAGTLHTLLFNLNPLMRFDGYHILADAMDMPNLYSRSRQAVLGCFQRLFFGTKTGSPAESAQHRRIFIYVYGFAALIWQVTVCVGLSIAAINFVPGVGLLMAALGAVMWLGIPLWKLLRYLGGRHQLESPNRWRFALVSFALLAIAVGLAFGASAPTTIRAPLVVIHDSVVVRARTDGFVREIHVQVGQRVTRGQLLLTLDNPELLTEITKTLVDIEDAQTKSMIHFAESEISLWQLVQEHLRGLEIRRRGLVESVEYLEVRAPASGVVAAGDLKILLGQFVTAGEELLAVDRSDSYRAVALVDQGDAQFLRDVQPQRMTATIWGTGETKVFCRIERVHPRAGFDLPHAAFAASLGGPIAVLDRQQADNHSQSQADSLLARNTSSNAGSPSSTSAADAGLRRDPQTGTDGARRTLTEAMRGLKTTRPYVQVDLAIAPETDGALDHEASARVAVDRPTISARPSRSGAPARFYEGQTGVLLASGRHGSLGSWLMSNLQDWINSRTRLTHGL